MNGEKKALSVKRQNQWKVAEEQSIKEDTELYERQKREGNVPGNKKYIPRVMRKRIRRCEISDWLETTY